MGKKKLLLIAVLLCGIYFADGFHLSSRPQVGKVFVETRKSPLPLNDYRINSHHVQSVDQFSQFNTHEELTTQSPKQKSFGELVWNDKTQLVAYLTVWYLGNIVCEYYQILCCSSADNSSLRQIIWQTKKLQML